MMQQLKELALKAVNEKVFPGCVLGVSRNGAREIIETGSFTYENNATPVVAETLYDLASITKSIPTASLAAIFEECKKLSFSDPVKKYIPELQNDYGATIEDLLTYRVHGERMSTLGFRTFEQTRTHIFETGFSGPPGESNYTNLPAYILGVIIERVGAGSIAALAHQYLFEPLKMNQTTFFPAKDDCPPTEIQTGVVIQGIAHDESTRLFALARRSVGHAGLFSTAGDLLHFFEAILDGEFPSVLFAAQKGLGWQSSNESVPSIFPEGTFGKTGFTGTYVAAHPGKKTALVILSNRTYPTRPSDATSQGSAINRFRKEVADIVFS
jgi:CubicO group peptidase (beta-lactamase class C family)